MSRALALMALGGLAALTYRVMQLRRELCDFRRDVALGRIG